MEVSNL